VRLSHQRHILRTALRPAAWTHFASDCDFGCACGRGLILVAIYYDGVHRETLRVDRTCRFLHLTLAVASQPVGSIADPKAMIFSGRRARS
jgi:hypothetical protein